MKNPLFFLIALTMLLTTTVSAKSAYDQNAKVAQFGLGIGGLGGFYGTSSIPVLSLGMDFGIDHMFSVGGRVGYTSSKFESPLFIAGTRSSYSWKYTYITVAGRGSYHYPIQHDKVDVYGGLDLGYNIVSAKYEGDPARQVLATGASSSYLFWGIHIGGRYFFSKNFAAFGEIGYGFGFLNLGISMKL